MKRDTARTGTAPRAHGAPAPRKLSLGTKLGFGVCDLGGNLFFTALGFYALKYLTDTVGIVAAVAGILLMVGKVVDAFWDPVLGFLSDRTRTRWGRRRPYLLFGSVPMALVMWWFFTNPHLATPVGAAVWGLGVFILLNVTYSVVNIPYSSLTPELTTDYHERSTLNGYRFMFAVVGTLLGGVAVDPIIRTFSHGAGGAVLADKSVGFSMVGLIFGAIMLVTALITGLTVREPARPKESTPAQGFLPTYLSVFRNRPYVVLLITYALHIIGITFLQSAITYYFTYVYQKENLQALAMGILLVVAMIFIPISVIVSKRIGKKLTYQLSLFIIASASLVLFFLGHLFGPSFFLGMMVYAGIGVGFSYVAPYAMVPDTIEVDAVRSGTRNEGAFYGVWLFTSKIGQAVSWLLTGLVLAIGGYIANAVQAGSAILSIRVMIGPLPALFLLGGVALVQFYPLDEKTYAGIIAKADKSSEQ
jgi:GPH family glycoside/pentoside/hexuronide:cation symporter